MYDPHIYDWRGGLRNLAIAGAVLVWMVFIRPIWLRKKKQVEGKENDWQSTIVDNAAQK